MLNYEEFKETGWPENNFFLCSVTGLRAVKLTFHQRKFVS
jgi:hypothetical protein